MKLVLAVLFVALWATVNEPIPAGFDTVFGRVEGTSSDGCSSLPLDTIVPALPGLATET
jgi:hypothetical protein